MIYYIYLITFIMKKLSKKRIEENMKHKEKKMKKIIIERDKMDPQSKLKTDKKKKMYRSFCISKPKNN